MSIVYEDQARMLAWASERLRRLKFRDDAVAIGRETGGQLAGVVVFDTHGPSSCLLHVAAEPGKPWASAQFLTHAMAYVFKTCGYHRITCTVSEHNAASLSFTRRFGWTEEGRLREQGPDLEDMIVFGLLARECSWQFGYGKFAAKGVSKA
jgi:RimJ/RimL family protein N-acetyltransferase